MQTYLTNHVTHSFAIFAEHVARSTSLLKPQSDLGAFSFGVGERADDRWKQWVSLWNRDEWGYWTLGRDWATIGVCGRFDW
jgi:hypothetical protein